MENGHSWFSSYLAPLMSANSGDSGNENKPAAPKAAFKRTLGNSAGLGEQLAGKQRSAFGDITNSDISSRHSTADNGKVKQHPAANGVKAVLQPSAQQQQQQQQHTQHPLLQQTFTDPSLIDGASHHAEKRGRRDWVDVDLLNLDDPQACAPYAEAIFQHLREAEVRRRPNPSYIDQFQPDMNSKMRAILVDWLVEVAEEYKLCADTLYLTVSYIDRFLSLHLVQRSHLQLVGVACMWLAAKYEEIYPPNINDFCYITDNTYSKEQMVGMEETVLKKLSYELTAPTSKTFLRRLLQICNPDELLHFLSNYLTELSLLDHNIMRFLPSVVAAAAVYLANLMLRRQGWDGNLHHYSTYTVEQITPCAYVLASLHQAVSTNSQLAAIRDKYAHPRFQAVSRLPVTQAVMQQLSQ